MYQATKYFKEDSELPRLKSSSPRINKLSGSFTDYNKAIRDSIIFLITQTEPAQHIHKNRQGGRH